MSEEEMSKSIENIKLMAQQINATIRIIRVYNGGIGHVCDQEFFTGRYLL